MLTFKLNNEPTNIQLIICYNRKSPIFQSHKSYKNSLQNIADFRSEIHNLSFKVFYELAE